jgi:NTP pyrophosphatase (non-canonical NTP hydrolase)
MQQVIEDLKTTIDALSHDNSLLRLDLARRVEMEKKEQMNNQNDYTFKQYQNEAQRTAIYRESLRVLYPTMGLGEVGEVQGKIKKVFRDKEGQFDEDTKKEIGKELGDVLWYVAILARDLDLDLEDIAQQNIAKLKSRQERGVLGGSGDNR